MNIFVVMSANLSLLTVRDERGQDRQLVDLVVSGKFGPHEPEQQMRVRFQPDGAAYVAKALLEEPTIRALLEPGTAH